MVPLTSHQVSRARWYSGYYFKSKNFRLQDYHLLWSVFPDRSTNFLFDNSNDPSVQAHWFRLYRFRSPLLSISRLMSFPLGTEMFHFPRLPSLRIVTITCYGVTPFGNRRVKGCLHLTDAYRSLPRPSSTVSAKAFTICT